MSIKLFIVLFLIVLSLVFIFQNTETVSVSFLMFEINMPRALLLIITLAAGLIIGIFIPYEFKKSRTRK